MSASSRSNSFEFVPPKPEKEKERSSSAPPQYVADRRRFVPKGTQILQPLPPRPSSSGAVYYVPGVHLVQQPTVWAGSLLAARLTNNWRSGTSPTGFTDLTLAINAALSLFSIHNVDNPVECIVRIS